MSDVIDLAAYTVHFRARVLQDALTESTSGYWIRRADQFEEARPRRGEHHGQADGEGLSRRWTRLTATAAACRNRAAVSLDVAIAPLVWDALGYALAGHREALVDVERRLDPSTALAAAEARLRAAIDAGDRDAIDAAAAEVDELDQVRTIPWTSPPHQLVADLIDRHRRVLAAVDAHRATLGAAA